MAWFDNTEWETRAFAVVPPRLWPALCGEIEIRRVKMCCHITGDRAYIICAETFYPGTLICGAQVTQDRKCASGALLRDRWIPPLIEGDTSFAGAVLTLVAWLRAVGVEVTTDARPLRKILETPG